MSLATVRIKGFRSIREAEFRPGPLSALVGEPGTGKSNLLSAIRSVLDHRPGAVSDEDLSRDGEQEVQISLTFSDGAAVLLNGRPGSEVVDAQGDLPSALYLPAALRSGPVVAESHQRAPHASAAVALITGAPDTAEPASGGRRGSTEAAHGLVAGVEACADAGVSGLVLLVEEPELFLPPQSQRYLYRMFRNLASGGNQILYSTHSPSFLNVARLDELVLTEHRPDLGTQFLQPGPLPTDDEFRAFSEFDAARSEMFLARAAVLVEGLTERLALPFVFRALGHDADRERISIVDCGGKSNIPLVGRISSAVGIPFVAVHDRDAPAGEQPNPSEAQLNHLIAEVAGSDGVVELAPDFEGIAGLPSHHHKPAHAWRRFAELASDEIPSPLAEIVDRAVEMASR